MYTVILSVENSQETIDRLKNKCNVDDVLVLKARTLVKCTTACNPAKETGSPKDTVLLCIGSDEAEKTFIAKIWNVEDGLQWSYLASDYMLDSNNMLFKMSIQDFTSKNPIKSQVQRNMSFDDVVGSFLYELSEDNGELDVLAVLDFIAKKCYD